MLVYVNEFFLQPNDNGLESVKASIKKWLGRKIGPSFASTKIIPFDRPFVYRDPVTGINEVTILGTPDHATDYCLSINYRHNDAKINGRAWYTRLGIERLETVGTLRVTVLLETSEISPQAAIFPVTPSLPGVVSEILKRSSLTEQTPGFQVHKLTAATVDQFKETIENPDRFHTLIVVSPDDFSEVPKINIFELQRLSIGLAQVYEIPHKREAWKLRDILAPYHTAWDGSIALIGPSRGGQAQGRVYRDGEIDVICSEIEASFESYLFGELTHRYNLSKSRRHVGDSYVSRRLTTFNLSRLREQLSGTAGLDELVRSYEEDRDKARQHAEALELKLLTTEDGSETLRSEIAGLENQIRTLQFQLKRANLAKSNKNHEQEPSQTSLSPKTLSELADWIDAEFATEIILINHARKTLEASPFDDASRVAETFHILATEFFGAFSNELRMQDAITALQRVRGKYSGNQSTVTAGMNKGYERTHEGRKYDLQKHIGLESSRDPRHCFRLYFEWDEISNKIIVLHAGGHLDTQST